MPLFNGLAKINIIAGPDTGQLSSNTFYLSHAGAGSPPDLTELTGLVNDLNTWINSTYRAIFPSTRFLQSISAEQVSDPTAPVVQEKYLLTVHQAGTRAPTGTSVPESLCAVIRLRTPNASRNFRGHNFMPPMTTYASLSGNLLNTSDSYYTSILAYVAKLAAGASPSPSWTGSTLSNYGLVIYSKTLAKLAQPSVALCNAVVIDGLVHFLRSRERGTT